MGGGGVGQIYSLFLIYRVLGAQKIDFLIVL